jgi:hypothetical protein
MIMTRRACRRVKPELMPCYKNPSIFFWSRRHWSGCVLYRLLQLNQLSICLKKDKNSSVP